jgi:hypothetical protein
MQRTNILSIKTGQNQPHKEKHAINKTSHLLNWNHKTQEKPKAREYHNREVGLL